MPSVQVFKLYSVIETGWSVFTLSYLDLELLIYYMVTPKCVTLVYISFLNPTMLHLAVSCTCA